MARPDGDAPDGEAASPGDHGGRVIAAPGAGARDDQHDVGGERGPPDLGGYRVRVIGLHVADERPGAGLPGPGGQQEGVAVGDVARPERRPDRPDLIPGRDDRGDGPPDDLEGVMPGRGGAGQIGRAEAVGRRDEQLAGREVLARGAHVQPAWRRAGDLGAAVGAELDPLALHHRVHARRHQVAGVDPDERAGGQRPHADGGRDGLDGDAVHRGTGGTGRGPARTDRGRRHPAEPVPDRHSLG